LDIAARLRLDLAWRNPPEIFLAMTQVVAPLSGLTYQQIGSQGIALPLPATVIPSGARSATEAAL
jgi:hypothetical protein